MEWKKNIFPPFVQQQIEKCEHVRLCNSCVVCICSPLSPAGGANGQKELVFHRPLNRHSQRAADTGPRHRPKGPSRFLKGDWEDIQLPSTHRAAARERSPCVGLRPLRPRKNRQHSALPLSSHFSDCLFHEQLIACELIRELKLNYFI